MDSFLGGLKGTFTAKGLGMFVGIVILLIALQLVGFDDDELAGRVQAWRNR